MFRFIAPALLLCCQLALAPIASASNSAAHAVVLLYHHVSDTTPNSTSTSPARFEQQLQYLQDNGFQVWSLNAIIEAFDSGRALPDKVVAISFDDGYRSVYDNAWPLLKKRGWPFSIFVSTDAIDQRYRYHATWEQLRQMAASGAEIENHGASHMHLLKKLADETEAEWLARVEQDIARAAQRIEAKIHRPSRLLAYPYGEYNQKLKQKVKAMGLIAFGQHSGPIGPGSDRQALARFPVAGPYTELSDFALKVSTLPMPVDTIDGDDNLLDYMNTRPLLALGFAGEASQYSRLRCFASDRVAVELQWQQSDPQRAQLRVQAAEPIAIGRTRYNCTMPAGNGRFYWLSQPWIRQAENNRWPTND